MNGSVSGSEMRDYRVSAQETSDGFLLIACTSCGDLGKLGPGSSDWITKVVLESHAVDHHRRQRAWASLLDMDGRPRRPSLKQYGTAVSTQ